LYLRRKLERQKNLQRGGAADADLAEDTAGKAETLYLLRPCGFRHRLSIFICVTDSRARDAQAPSFPRRRESDFTWQSQRFHHHKLDSRLRGNDEIGEARWIRGFVMGEKSLGPCLKPQGRRERGMGCAVGTKTRLNGKILSTQRNRGHRRESRKNFTLRRPCGFRQGPSGVYAGFRTYGANRREALPISTNKTALYPQISPAPQSDHHPLQSEKFRRDTFSLLGRKSAARYTFALPVAETPTRGDT
jgi:hypothetical protein